MIKTNTKTITKQDKKHITLCPTNLAALLVTVGGMTIHNFSTKLKKHSQLGKNLNLDYIFIHVIVFEFQRHVYLDLI
jgi:hypothetical protein